MRVCKESREVYKRRSIAKGMVKNIGKESKLLREKVGRKEKEPSFTEIQGLSFTSQMVNALRKKVIYVLLWKHGRRRPFAISITWNIICASLKKLF